VDKAFPLVSEPVYGEVSEQQGREMSLPLFQPALSTLRKSLAQ